MIYQRDSFEQNVSQTIAFPLHSPSTSAPIGNIITSPSAHTNLYGLSTSYSAKTKLNLRTCIPEIRPIPLGHLSRAILHPKAYSKNSKDDRLQAPVSQEEVSQQRKVKRSLHPASSSAATGSTASSFNASPMI